MGYRVYGNPTMMKDLIVDEGDAIAIVRKKRAGTAVGYLFLTSTGILSIFRPAGVR